MMQADRVGNGVAPIPPAAPVGAGDDPQHSRDGATASAKRQPRRQAQSPILANRHKGRKLR
jgi:hypothetical protein